MQGLGAQRRRDPLSHCIVGKIGHSGTPCISSCLTQSDTRFIRVVMLLEISCMGCPVSLCLSVVSELYACQALTGTTCDVDQCHRLECDQNKSHSNKTGSPGIRRGQSQSTKAMITRSGYVKRELSLIRWLKSVLSFEGYQKNTPQLPKVSQHTA